MPSTLPVASTANICTSATTQTSDSLRSGRGGGMVGGGSPGKSQTTRQPTPTTSSSGRGATKPQSSLSPSGRGGGAAGGGSAGRSQPSQQPAPTASTSSKSPTKPPRPCHKAPGNTKPRITRPPKSNSQGRPNKYRALEMDMGAEDHSALDSDFPNPFDT